MRLLIEELQHFHSSSDVNDYTCQAGSHSLNTLFHFKSNNVAHRDSTKDESHDAFWWCFVYRAH